MMKKAITLLVLCVLFTAMASAQLRYGIKLGCGFSCPAIDCSSDRYVDNGAGFVGGLQLEYQMPVCGFAFGVSALYEHRTITGMEKLYSTVIPGQKYTPQFSHDKYGGAFISLPLDIKYKIGISALHDLVSPYVLTGPDFAFRLSDGFGPRMHTGWNVGGGIDIVNFIQISGGYRFGLSKFDGIRDNGAFVNVGILFDF